jgi:hypothetical protein
MVVNGLGNRDEARKLCGEAIELMNASKRDSEDYFLRVFRREALAELGLTEADFAKPKDKN